jgi:hypothetical protein
MVTQDFEGRAVQTTVLPSLSRLGDHCMSILQFTIKRDAAMRVLSHVTGITLRKQSVGLCGDYQPKKTKPKSK